MVNLYKVNAKPFPKAKIILPWVLFIISILLYSHTSYNRHKENPKDKLVPSIKKMLEGFKRTAFEPDRKNEYRLLKDTMASGRRFFISLFIICFGIIIGLNMGALPYIDLLLYRFVLFCDKIPALSLLPILFIVFGLGETSKIALVVIGVMPTIILDTYLHTKAFHRELVIKSMTLDASNGEIIYKIILPNILPRVLDTIRLNFKSIIIFLIAGEALAANSGLGYRIFVVRRYLAMDIIIPYVIWISVLAFSADLLVRLWIKYKYPWANK